MLRLISLTQTEHLNIFANLAQRYTHTAITSVTHAYVVSTNTWSGLPKNITCGLRSCHDGNESVAWQPQYFFASLSKNTAAILNPNSSLNSFLSLLHTYTCLHVFIYTVFYIVFHWINTFRYACCLFKNVQHEGCQPLHAAQTSNLFWSTSC